MIIQKLKFITLFLFTTTCGFLSADPSHANDFFVLTIAKGGTTLVNKLMRIITNKQTCTTANPQNVNTNCYAFHHLANYNDLYRDFYKANPNVVPIIHIRDLRDVCVALTFAHKIKIDNLIGKQSSFDEELLFIIENPNLFGTHDWKRNAENAVLWLKDSNSVFSRFEEIVGEKGGGSKVKQREAIKRIANALNIVITQDKWDQINNQLFGTTVTFRSGQIGEWRKYFKEKHKNAFKLKAGNLLIALGYAENNKW